MMRITSDNDSNEQLLYFTSSSLDATDGHLVYISDRTGSPNLFTRDLATGIARRLTDNREGTLKSYVYFFGSERRGLGKASVSFDPIRRVLYYIQNDGIRCVTPDGVGRVLARVPSGQVTAFTHVSADGRLLCVPTTDERALDTGNQSGCVCDRPDYDIDERMRREGLSSCLNIYDTRTGRLLAAEKVPLAWITHVQFNPVDPSLILYNHEWPADCGVRRLWLWDGKRHLRLRREGGPRSRDDWTCHEMWQPDGGHVIYHGKYKNGSPYIGRVSARGGGPVEIPLPEKYRRYGHFTVGNRNDNWLVTDGYYHPMGMPENEKQSGEWICRLCVDWKARKIGWHPLCEHLSTWDCQDSHPHPIFNHTDTAVYFTSDKDGRRAIFRVDVDARRIRNNPLSREK
ncbi:MAG: oligogalacturonate lyase family protein [Opitutaceae bacterium]|jgi:hypothetical protein|nr:oligogalacturonate lyase family protein [Opitutaceae bacterium]